MLALLIGSIIIEVTKLVWIEISRKQTKFKEGITELRVSDPIFPKINFIVNTTS